MFTFRVVHVVLLWAVMLVGVVPATASASGADHPSVAAYPGYPGYPGYPDYPGYPGYPGLGDCTYPSGSHPGNRPGASYPEGIPRPSGTSLWVFWSGGYNGPEYFPRGYYRFDGYYLPYVPDLDWYGPIKYEPGCTYPVDPNYPGYPNTGEPPTCPTGQVGVYPNCQVVVAPPKDPKPEDPKPEDPKPEDPKPQVPQGDAGPPVVSGPPAPPGVTPPTAAPKPTLAFKGKVKVNRRGQFSVACVVASAPAGAKCRLRIIVGKRGTQIATTEATVVANAARLRLRLTSKQLKKVPRSRKVRVALDLVGANGSVILSARQSVKLPRR